MSIKWRIEGPFDSTYSLALLNREIARGLDNCGVDVALFSTEGPGDFEPSAEFLTANPDLKELYQRSYQMTQAVASVTSRNLFPPRVEDMTCRSRMMHLYAWEETAFPAQWVRNFNAHLTGMTCLSSHVMRTMIDNGVRVPMTVGGCGVDHWERVEAGSTSLFEKITNKSFVFLHVSSFFPRKGPDALLEAYGRAFTELDDVCLVIKTFPNPHNRIHEQLADVRLKYKNYPDVVIIEDDLSDSDLKALYQRCDVLVAPSCAEGFGLPLAEAMLSGLPVITTGWSGQLDFCSSDCAWLVDFTYEQADTHFRLLPSAWAAVNLDDLAAAMKSAFATEPAARRRMAELGRQRLLKDFTWESVAKRLISFNDALENADVAKKLKFGWISTWNVKCGIATYSMHLTEHLTETPYMLAARNDAILEADDDMTSRCWSVGDDDDLSDLSDEIEQKNLDALIIQFNFGFFDHDNLFRFVKQQKDAGRIVVIDMHATANPPQAKNKKMANFVPALKLADRLLVHSIADMNRLKAAGLTENLTLFPHGIMSTDTDVQYQPEIPTIATYGFCLPHKGLEEVVEAVAILRDQGTPVRLKMVNAEYPVDFSKELVARLHAKVHQLGLQALVDIESDFLTDDQSLTILKHTDMLLFVYFPTSESASGAVRYGLASGKPTLVTDLPIFSEFGDAVWRVADNQPERLANVIRDSLSAIRSNTPENQRKQELAKEWRSQHQYSWLSERLEGMLHGIYLSRQLTPVI